MKNIRWYLLLLTLFPFSSDAAVVLLYHHVSDTTPKSTSISPVAFEAQLDYLEKNHFKVVPLPELVDMLRKGKSLPDKTVAISFDDSYASVYESAYPRLKKRGWPFTFFVNTDSVGTGKLFVSWEQLREMASNGVTIANHTSTHTHLPRKNTGESLQDYRRRIRTDIAQAQQKIAREIGEAPMMLAYPFGEYDVEVQQIAKQLGYIAFGQQSGVLYEHGDLQAVPRFPFGGSFTALDDFIMKVNTKPMPTRAIKFFADKNNELENVIVRAGDKPWLVLQLTDTRLLGKINCFATGQGPIKVEVIDRQLWVQAKQPLTAGRMRYNCTAYAGENGRFFWYTQQWLVTDNNGQWTYKD